jgi:hypothetical protein
MPKPFTKQARPTYNVEVPTGNIFLLPKKVINNPVLLLGD